uniref:Uncharacterized protein n=1 Tax=Glossina pallidipes TaxID=7398 RepID=A0A1A9ZXH8_GLOPL
MLQKTVLSQQLNTFLDETQWLTGHQMTSGLPAVNSDLRKLRKCQSNHHHFLKHNPILVSNLWTDVNDAEKCVASIPSTPYWHHISPHYHHHYRRYRLAHNHLEADGLGGSGGGIHIMGCQQREPSNGVGLKSINKICYETRHQAKPNTEQIEKVANKNMQRYF